MLPDLSIIIVNWNVRDLLRDCLRSIDAGRGALSVEVIVVDSASSDGSAEMVGAEFSWVRLIPCDDNVGFPRGNNIGLAESRGRYLMLLNPDTVVLEAGAHRLRWSLSSPGVRDGRISSQRGTSLYRYR